MKTLLAILLLLCPLCCETEDVLTASFPDMLSTRDDLGVDNRNNRVSLSYDAPLKDVSAAIMQG